MSEGKSHSLYIKDGQSHFDVTFWLVKPDFWKFKLSILAIAILCLMYSTAFNLLPGYSSTSYPTQ